MFILELFLWFGVTKTVFTNEAIPQELKQKLKKVQTFTELLENAQIVLPLSDEALNANVRTAEVGYNFDESSERESRLQGASFSVIQSRRRQFPSFTRHDAQSDGEINENMHDG
ncbi:hypothetical protein AB6A40_011405 [Gnathostoma spinigerum]|uniref:Uncharacterized protein n=1 Tax=Gnathostoma spinigerum TaxID=75299 RepID=A0ABD6EXQ5_9BILA